MVYAEDRESQREGEGRGSRGGSWGEVRKVWTSWLREKKGWSARDWRKLREREREGAQYCILVKHSNC